MTCDGGLDAVPTFPQVLRAKMEFISGYISATDYYLVGGAGYSSQRAGKVFIVEEEGAPSEFNQEDQIARAVAAGAAAVVLLEADEEFMTSKDHLDVVRSGSVKVPTLKIKASDGVRVKAFINEYGDEAEMSLSGEPYCDMMKAAAIPLTGGLTDTCCVARCGTITLFVHNNRECPGFSSHEINSHCLLRSMLLLM